jgi:hypothetical protein
MARIAIADLPPLETIPQEEMERIFGAGRFRPAVEALEDRQLLSGTPYSIAQAITHSAENYTKFVTEAYHRYLGRLPDAPGLASWVQGMQQGLSDERLEAGFIGSPEYIQDHGGQGAGWVTGMYKDLLGRAPAQSEVENWLQVLNQGASTTAVAYGFAASPEREGERITADYRTYLGRFPGSSEVAGWVDNFEHGVSNEDVVGGFVGSPEYYDRAGGNVDSALWLLSVYRSVLGREPAEADYVAWVGHTPGPGTRVAVNWIDGAGNTVETDYVGGKAVEQKTWDKVGNLLNDALWSANGTVLTEYVSGKASEQKTWDGARNVIKDVIWSANGTLETDYAGGKVVALKIWDSAGKFIQHTVTAADGSVWFLGTTAVGSAGNHAIYRVSNGQITRMPGAGSSLVLGVNGRMYLDSAQHLLCWSQQTGSWIEPGMTGTGSQSGLGLIDLNPGNISINPGDILPTSPGDAQDKWNHIVNEAQAQGQILVDNVLDYAVYPAATAGAAAYAAGAADMAAQFGQRGEALTAADKQFFRAAFGGVYSRDLLDNVVIHYNCTMPNSWYAGDTEGITFGFNIYLRPAEGTLSDRDRLTLIGHELMHAVQYDRLSRNLFAFGYQYFQELSKAGGNYAANSMEQEAYKQQDRVAAAYDKAVKVVNETASAMAVRLTYQVPDPSAAPGLYLTTPTITLQTDLTVQPGQTAIAYQPTRPDASLLPVDQINSVGGIIHVQITSDAENTLWPSNYRPGGTANVIVLQPAFFGI